jgi:hypothetical protein
MKNRRPTTREIGKSDMSTCPGSSSRFQRRRFRGERPTPSPVGAPERSGALVVDASRCGAETRPWSWKVSAGGAGTVVVFLLTSGSIPTASAQPGLPDWLSRASIHVSDIHKAEDALVVALKQTAVTNTVDVPALLASCTQLRDANAALRGQMPTPDPKLTAEVQQAIDNFDTASPRGCNIFLNTPNVQTHHLLLEILQTADRHLSSADAILFALSGAG